MNDEHVKDWLCYTADFASIELRVVAYYMRHNILPEQLKAATFAQLYGASGIKIKGLLQ